MLVVSPSDSSREHILTYLITNANVIDYLNYPPLRARARRLMIDLVYHKIYLGATLHPQEKYRDLCIDKTRARMYNMIRCQAICDRGGIGIRARLRGVSDKGTGSSPVDRTKDPWS